MDLWTQQGKERVRNIESIIDVHTLPCITKIATGNMPHGTENSARCSVMTKAGGMGRWEGGSRGKEKICILITDSHYCTAGTNTTVESNYPPFEKKNGLINFHDAPKTLKRAKKLKCKFLM